MTLRSVRNSLLALSLFWISIPGFVGLDLSLAGVRLGRFQPFKVFFMAWLVTQTLWVIKHRKLALPKSRQFWIFTLATLILDLCLLIGLGTEKGGQRGFSIWIALVLGQWGACVTLLDSRFSIKPVKWGLMGAIIVIAVFACLEVFAPTSTLTVSFLKLVRDQPQVSYQLGASLTAPALAEFSVRTLPLLIFDTLQSGLIFCGAFLLLVMGVLTLERSAALSLIFILAFAFISPRFKRFRFHALGVGLAAVSILVVYQGPEKIIGRYFGFLSSNTENKYVAMSRLSNNERLHLWEFAVKTIQYRPWTGIGLDGFATRLEEKREPLNEPHRLESTHSHNLFLEFGVSGGIFALLAFSVLFFGYGWEAWLARGKSWSHWVPVLYWAGQLVSCMTDARIYVSWLGITFFWFAALAWKVNKTGSEYGV